jgi:hypothetical protein
MGSIRFRALACLILLVAVVFGPASEGRDAPAGKDSKADKAKPPSVPPGTVIAIFEKVADAFGLRHDLMILSTEDYNKLREAAKQLKALADAPVYAPPSKCHLKGHVESGLLVLTVTFEYDAAKRGSLINLACGQGLATSASIEGKSPALLANVKAAKGEALGYAVRADAAGQQALKLELLVPLGARPGGHGFTLDLPAAAITQIDIELPPGSRDPRVGGKAPEGGTKLKGRTLSGPVGPLEKLDLSWGSPAAAGTPVTDARGAVTVKVGPRETTCEANLTLRVLGGQVKEWQLLVPPGAQITTDMARVETIIADKKFPARRTLRLKEATSDPLTVTVRTIGPTPRTGAGKASVGPFTVVGAKEQKGTALVSNTAQEYHLDLKPLGDLRRRGLAEAELKRDPSLVAAFDYGPDGASGPSWLDIEAEHVAGQIKARSTHVLRLVMDDDGPFWRVETTALVTPRWADVGRLSVELPKNCEWEPEPNQAAGPRVRSASFDPGTRHVEFRLKRTGEPGNKPFTVRVVARYTGTVPLTGDATLTLPRPGGTLDPDGAVTVHAPPGLELLPADNPALELTRQAPHELAYNITQRRLRSVALSWRPYRAPVEVASLVYLTLVPGEGSVTHELTYKFPAVEAPRELHLRLPAAIAASVKVTHGTASVQGNQLRFAPPADGKLVLTYAFPLPADGPIGVPLAVPEGASRVETKALVWSEAGWLPALAPDEGEKKEGPDWRAAPIEEVKGRPGLPVLVARVSAAPSVLRLRRGEAGTVNVSRALVRATVHEAGDQEYHVSYRVEWLSDTHIDFTLPFHYRAMNLRAEIAGKKVVLEELPAEPSLRGKLVRLRLAPGLLRGPAVLDLKYELPPEKGNPFGVTLETPKLVDCPPGLSVRWQIITPPGWVLLGPEPGASMPRTWGLSGWLLAPRPTITQADLEQWLVEKREASPSAEAVSPTLSLWVDGPQDVTLVRTSRQAWLLGCSLLLFVIGFGLGWLATREGSGPTWAWCLGLALLVAVVVVATLWPHLAGQFVYGCQPGLAALLVLGLVLWLLHERRRRQLLFLPSFTRALPGSSMSQQEPPSSPRPPGDQPSTVDAPRSLGGLERLGG